jgi:hypothetical protein
MGSRSPPLERRFSVPFSLFDDLKISGFHSSILTTFSVDPAFYDANIQYRLRVSGCQNNMLIADASMLDQSLEEMPEAFIHAGRKYLIVPVSSKGCFHPKIILRYGASKGRLVLGSANATSAGWGNNREVLSALEWSSDGRSGDSFVHLGLIAKVHSWLISTMDRADPDIAYKLSLLETQSPWLNDAPRNEGVQQFEDGSLVDVLWSDPESVEGLGRRFVAEIEEDVQRLVIISPYWDNGLGALRDLSSALGGPAVHIFMTVSENPETRQSTFPVTALSGALKPKFHPLVARGHHRFLHAKLIVAQTKKHDHVLYGSANCTLGALGRKGATGINYEAAIFRRLQRGTIDRELKLDYSTTIHVKDIYPPQGQVDVKLPGPKPFHAGRVELKGDRLIWSCPVEIQPDGAILLIAGSRLKMETPAGARPHVKIDRATIEATLVVRIELADGRTSRSLIVSDPDLLRASAPNPLSGNLKRKLDSVLSGDIDLIDLARDVHLLFDEGGEGGRSRALAAGVGRGHSVSSRVSGQDYASPEAFRNALGLKADLHSGLMAHPDNPALQLILQIVLRGIVQLEGSSSIERSDIDSIDALEMGEDQDDAGEQDSVGPEPATPPITAKTSLGPTIEVKRLLFERNRTALTRSVNRFENYVEAIANSDSIVGLNFVTRTLFMIYLMLYGSSRCYSVDGETMEVLIPFSGIGTDKQGSGFLIRSARLISRIWGRSFRTGIMGRLSLDRELETLPVQVLTLIILTRWILAAILSEARCAPGALSLAGILEKQVPTLFVMTSAFANTDPFQIEAAIRQMAKHIGMTQLQADAIQEVLRELSASGHLPAAK